MNVHTGEVLANCGPTRTGDDMERHMDRVAARWPTVEIHVVLDNLNIHKGERWRRFNERHGQRFHFHYTPLHASWVNQIELFFGVLGRRCLRRKSFRSTDELAAHLLAFVTRWNDRDKKPFQVDLQRLWHEDRGGQQRGGGMMMSGDMPTSSRRKSNPSRSQSDTAHPLVLIVREKLLTLGDFAHLLVYRAGDHLFIAHAGPPDAPDPLEPVLRITHAGHLALRPVPSTPQRSLAARAHFRSHVRALFELLSDAVRTFGPWLAPR